jgi:hypothetical protein
LLVYLQDSDSEAVHLVSSIAEQLKNSVHASAFTAVRLAVNNFDFDLALNALQEFRKALNKAN